MRNKMWSWMTAVAITLYKVLGGAWAERSVQAAGDAAPIADSARQFI